MVPMCSCGRIDMAPTRCTSRSCGAARHDVVALDSGDEKLGRYLEGGAVMSVQIAPSILAADFAGLAAGAAAVAGVAVGSGLNDS